MRVQLLGGLWRGRPVAVPKVAGLRPTAQKVRKALYDILGARVVGASVLDLYAGTGALGLEALSRGATRVVFVDHAPACTDAIRRTLTTFGLPAGATVELLTQHAVAAVRRLARAGQSFDLILLDPPYEAPVGRKSLQAIAGSAILAPSGVVVIEVAQRQEVPERLAGPPGRRLAQGRVASYGDTRLVFYHWMTPSPILGPPLAGRPVDAASGGKTGDGVTEDPS